VKVTNSKIKSIEGDVSEQYFDMILSSFLGRHQCQKGEIDSLLRIQPRSRISW